MNLFSSILNRCSEFKVRIS